MCDWTYCNNPNGYINKSMYCSFDEYRIDLYKDKWSDDSFMTISLYEKNSRLCFYSVCFMNFGDDLEELKIIIEEIIASRIINNIIIFSNTRSGSTNIKIDINNILEGIYENGYKRM